MFFENENGKVSFLPDSSSVIYLVYHKRFLAPIAIEPCFGNRSGTC